MTIWVEPGTDGNNVTITNTWRTHIAKTSDVLTAPWGWDADGTPVYAEVTHG